MAKTNGKTPSLALRLIYAVALIFLCVGMCVLGSFRSAGASFELISDESASETPSVVFLLERPTIVNEKGEEEQIYARLHSVYVNIGAAYTAAGEAVTLKAEGMSSATGGTTSARRITYTFSNFASSDGKDASLASDILYNWVCMGTSKADASWNISTYDYIKLTAEGSNVRINEVVFVGERTASSTSSAERQGEFYVLPARVEAATPLAGESRSEAAERAAALVDAQHMPARDASRFNRFTPAEQVSLMTIAEMRAGGAYTEGNVYEGERVYGALGEDILALGTLIFGMSPFGLRFFPMLAAAGALLVGALFVRRLTKRDGAGLVFAVLFALASATLAFGGLGTPLMPAIFFFLLSLDMCHRFYANGMRGTGIAAALPLIVSGLAGAFAILIHGAFIVPVAGVAALFGLGIVRQLRARRYHLDAAIAAAEETERRGEDAAAARQAVASVAREYRTKTAVASVAFGCALVIGAVVFALLFALPMYYPYIKMFSDPAAPSMNIFTLAAKSFAGGFCGVNAASSASGAFSIFHVLSRGTGEAYSAVFGAFMNPVAILAALAGLAYLVFGAVRLVQAARGGRWGKEQRALLRRLAVPFAAGVLALITAAFAKEAVLFVLLAWVFSFALAAQTQELTAAEGRTGKTFRIVMWTGFGLLAALFALYFVFAAGLPLPSSLITALFG